MSIIRRFQASIPGHSAAEDAPVSFGSVELDTDSFRGAYVGHVVAVSGDAVTIATGDARLIKLMESGQARFSMRPGGHTLFASGEPDQAPDRRPDPTPIRRADPRPSTPTPELDLRARIFGASDRARQMFARSFR